MSRREINYEENDATIQNIVDRIELGYELQNLDENLEDKDILKYNDVIIIAPDYQRDYRSTIAEESSLIESVLLGIPIPPIFLANTLIKNIQVLNVIDGQHRLRAFFRFIKDDYKLSKLSMLKEYEGSKFSQLNINTKRSIISTKISCIIFRGYLDEELEIEIFNRYNKGTKPLTQQEIRHAVYNSKFNTYVNNFAKKELENCESVLSKSYNISKNRVQKKKVQENLFVILSILENGIDIGKSKSPNYTETFMEVNSKLEKEHRDTFDIKYELIIGRFSQFNKFVSELSRYHQYPFSKELYGISCRNYKFQISIAMILAGICYKIIKETGEENFSDIIDYKLFLNNISEVLINSFLEDPEYVASSTNSKEIRKIIDAINVFDCIINQEEI